MNGEKPGVCNVANNRTLYTILKPFNLAHSLATPMTMNLILISMAFSVFEVTFYKRRKKQKVNQSRYRPGRFQVVKVPRFHDNGTGWW